MKFCATRGDHRKAALRLLHRPLPTAAPKRSGPKVRYDPAEVLPVLKTLWLASDPLCSKLLQAALPAWLGHHERRAAPLPEAFKRRSENGWTGRPADRHDAGEPHEIQHPPAAGVLLPVPAGTGGSPGPPIPMLSQALSGGWAARTSRRR